MSVRARARAVDRRKRLAPSGRSGDLLPAAARAARGGPEATIEVTTPVDRPHDLVELDDLEARRALADEAECLDHLFVGQHHPNVVGLAAQAGDQLGDRRAAPCAHEIVLRIDAGQPGGARSRHVA